MSEKKMKVAILCGGLGTRLSEETELRPKPMVEIGGKPILWHIMKTYSHYGFNEFVLCLGYKGFMIKEWFANYFLHNSDVTINLKKNDLKVHNTNAEDWVVTLTDTGERSDTGGRVKRIEKFIDGPFMLTYGDGVCDVNLKDLTAFHRKHGKMATLTGVQPPGRFGALEIAGDSVTSFEEKPKGDGSWINGGYFVLEPAVFDFIPGDGTSWEKESMANIAKKGELKAFRHFGFWKPMDTIRDKKELEEKWASGNAPWKVWK